MTPRPPSKKTSRWGFVLCIFSFASAIALMVHLTGQRTTVTALDFEPADTGTKISAKSTVQPESSFKNKDAFVSATATVPDHSTVPSSKTNFEPLSAEPKIDAVTGSIFDDFKAWSRQYLEHSCKNNTHDQLCDRLDPRVLNGMLRAGEKLAKARKVEMTALMRKDPKKAISLAIQPSIAQNLPPQISVHLEKWENALVNLQSLHACSFQDHSSCDIQKITEFPDGRKLVTHTYGARSDPAPLKGVSAWGVSLGNEFAMSDLPTQEISTDGEGGKLLFGGKELTFDSRAENNISMNLWFKVNDGAEEIQQV